MKSIDNLREYVLTAPSICSTTRAILVGYIDNIEREVGDNERFRAEAEPFADRLREAVGERADVTLFGVDYTPLPVDADGEAIHVGDVMENIVCPPVHREVTGVGVECFYGWEDGNGRYSQFDASCYRHHHAPTVEDVLREFYVYAVRGKAAHAEDVDGAVLAEYAAKLRLVGDE